ncbi:MAG: menaquinone biosynthesis protein [Verrucomicrobiae bacterium]|nr:menaquinone biosynthesis protein [Verrucomicrobiae bacterium]
MKNESQQPEGRIGSVPYLNAHPLIFGLQTPVFLDVPARLARRLREGRLDVALVSLAEYFSHPRYHIVPASAIVSQHAAGSILLIHTVPLDEIKTVHLDPSSRTSNLLCRVALAHFFHRHPRYILPKRHYTRWRPPCPKNGEARLIIGDPALRERDRFKKAGCRVTDLGALWRRHTGLPFVFALWLARGKSHAMAWNRPLLQAKAAGLRHLKQIASAQNVISPAAALYYLRHNLRYHLGKREWHAIRLFLKLCHQLKLFPKTTCRRLC